jgi:two-component system, chemotaxis family, sensor kinase CheA
MDKDPYKYFRLEARELLDGLSQGVLELERGATSKDLVSRLLRFAHTLKGAARVVKLAEIATQVHAVEDALAPFRDQDRRVPQETIDELLRLLDAVSGRLATIDPAAPVTVDAPAPSAVVEEPIATVRVELAEMDVLLEGVTEATVHIHSLQRETETLERAQRLAALLVDQLGSRAGGDSLDAPVARLRAQSLAEDLRGTLARLRRTVPGGVELVARELAQVRDAANGLRLLPASMIFGPLERAARDAAHASGKNVLFQTSGGEQRLDAHVLDALRNALLHLVRNAVAHGIEPEAQRSAAGKAATGHIRLHVERRGSEVAFVCRDDGAGIDVEAVRRAATKAGLLPPARAAAASQQELFGLLLKGGLTTARRLTEVSGRGVGLDVARETVAQLGGEVVIESTAGRGTSIELRVPISLSSISTLVVDAGGATAVVPLDAVRQTLRLGAAEIARSPANDTIVYEGQIIPFVPLARALRRPSGSARERSHWSAVVVQSGSALVAVGVDRLLGTASVVVRPLPTHAAVEPVVMGAALDAEGHPQVVLDPAGLVVAAQTEHGAVREPERAPRLPVLVIDDSLTTRMLEQSILESAGYTVELATSAEEALTKAWQHRYGAFVVDVEMPGMSGFEFVATTRSDPKLREVPAILVTSRNAPEDRRRGEEVGARAYVVKGEFDQAFLLQTIRQLVG